MQNRRPHPFNEAALDARHALIRQHALQRQARRAGQDPNAPQAAVGGPAQVGGPVSTGLDILIIGLAVVGGYVLYSTWNGKKK